MIVMLIITFLVAMILFVITFVFQSMNRMHFNLATISIYETINMQLESVFSLWYYDIENQPINPGDDLRKIEIPTYKLSLNDYDWLETETTKLVVSFNASHSALEMAVDNNATKTIFSHPYLKDVTFFTQGRELVATFIFQDYHKKIEDTKIAKFRTIN